MLIVSVEAVAEPFTFKDASQEIRDFVIERITNYIDGASIALMHERTDEVSHREDALMHWSIAWELRLKERRCIEMLKGNPEVAGYKVCYLYETPRLAKTLPRLVVRTSERAGDSDMGYFDGGAPFKGRFIPLTEKNLWKYMPPYDPYLSFQDEFVRLMILTPESELDVKCIRPDKFPCNVTNFITIVGKDYTNQTSAAIMRALHVEAAFSNRVFRMNEGCAFQVDYPIPDLDWRGSGTVEEHRMRLAKVQSGNTVLMHLSAREVSEIVYLAYLVDGDSKGYVTACSRCPKILSPVKEFKTEIGTRLAEALQAGGMLCAGTK